MLIENAEVSDASALADLAATCLHEAWSESSFRDIISGTATNVLVLRQGPDICGYAAYMIAADEAELLSIAVDKAARGRGYGRILFSEMKKLATQRGAKSLYLDVRAGNDAAIKLYESFGMETVSRRKNYYDAPIEDALIYRMELG